jgi:hypothetical protein
VGFQANPNLQAREAGGIKQLQISLVVSTLCRSSGAKILWGLATHSLALWATDILVGFAD